MVLKSSTAVFALVINRLW